MESTNDGKSDKLSNLDRELQKIEQTHGESVLGKAIEGGFLTNARRAVVGVAGSYRQSRFNFGRVLRRYKQHFKAQRGWVAAATLIAEAISCDVRTIFRIIDGYERAQSLSPLVLEALEEQGFDLAAVRNAELVEDLLEASKPESTMEARKLVAEQHRNHVARKKGKKAMAKKPTAESFERFADRIVSQFRGRYRTTSQDQRVSEVRLVFEQVLDGLAITFEELNHHGQLTSVAKPEMREAA